MFGLYTVTSADGNSLHLETGASRQAFLSTSRGREREAVEVAHRRSLLDKFSRKPQSCRSVTER
jgi:hypothetical protein